MNTMSFDELIEASHRAGLIDSYVDRDKLEYGFFEVAPEDAEFAFHIVFREQRLLVEGFRRYYRFQLSASKDASISFEVLPQLGTITDTRPGPDANALAAELAKFPGFMDMNEVKAKLGLR